MSEEKINKDSDIVNRLLNALSGLITPAIKVYTISEIAEILHCDERTVQYYIFRTKELSTCKIGKKDPIRVRHEDLQLFLQNRRSPCIYDRVLT